MKYFVYSVMAYFASMYKKVLKALYKVRKQIATAFALMIMQIYGSVTWAAVTLDTIAIDDQYTNLTDNIGYLEGKAWPVAMLVTSIFVGLALFKRFTNRAAS